jgi:hypothetical protein
MAPTARPKADMSFSHVVMVETYHASLKSKTSSHYQHLMPTISPAPKPPESEIASTVAPRYSECSQQCIPAANLP